MKMAGLLWMSVSVLLLESCTGITPEELTPLVNDIWRNYHAGSMFSIAASIPNTQNGYDFNQILQAENPQMVKETMRRGGVYASGRIVAATVIPKSNGPGNIHAEYRVLQNFDNLLNQQLDYDDDLMLFYVLASPCVQRCTNENNPENILEYLDHLKRWRNHIFVFSYLYRPNYSEIINSDVQRKNGIRILGNNLGLQNVFRCDKINRQMQCRTCKNQNNRVADFCFSDHTFSLSDDENSVAPAPAVPNDLIQRGREGRGTIGGRGGRGTVGGRNRRSWWSL